MSTDRELLEMAAKAAGVVVVRWNDGLEPYSSGLGFIIYSGRLWNPLTNDGDALLLAVKLHIDLKFYDGHVVAGFDGGLIGTGRIYYGDDPAAATRLAIVRAAAEHGKAMP